MSFHKQSAVAALALTVSLTATAADGPTVAHKKAPTSADAAHFIAQVNADDKASYPESTAAAWLAETFITDDSQLVNAKAGERGLALLSRQIEDSKKYKDLKLPPEVARQLLLVRISSAVPAPSAPAKRAELAQLATKLDGEYGAGKYCPPGKKECQNLDQLEEIINHSRDPAALAEAWAGWHSIGRPMRSDYVHFAELMNDGAHELGFKDTGELWRAGYDMSPQAFSQETERLWSQVKPLYTQLHCYVRSKLHDKYGSLVPENGLIPADLLGNMWAQEWTNIYDLVQPYPDAGSLDVSGALQARHDALETKMMGDFRADYARQHGNAEPSISALADAEHQVDIAYAKEMAKISEDFYTSIGFPPLPGSFYEKSMLTRPRDRDVVCHASAWDMDQSGDVRIKMCIRPDEESLTTIHHEMGHIYYYLMYNPLAFLYQAGAHDGFHEAIGDTITLSLTPQHLQRVGLVDKVVDDQHALINAQMKRALEKIAFLPFGKLIDQWRWQVFSGQIKTTELNKGWWTLREKYQGIKAPVARSESDFDPGAKYHIPGNTPYTRYFLSFIIQFQFHKALCDAAGFKGPLYLCDIYGSKDAGAKFMAMLQEGASEPWQDTLYKLTGTRDMDGSAIIEYFQPLMQYLQQQNQGKSCGWAEDGDPLESQGPADPTAKT